VSYEEYFRPTALATVDVAFITKYNQRRDESANSARGILGKYEIVYLNNINNIYHIFI
jgi:hypothetical protein